MNIQGALMFYHINRSFSHTSYFCPSNKTKAAITRPMFWGKPSDMKGHLVVVDTSQLAQLVHPYSNTLFICVNCRPSEVEGLPNECITIEDKVDTQAVFNKLLKIFDSFLEWEKELDQALNQFLSFDAIIRSCDNLIEEPLALVDDQFRYVGYSKRLAYENSFEDMYVGEGGSVPLEDINRLTAMPDFYELEKKHEPFQYVCIENLIHMNVFDGDHYIGRIAIPFSKNPVKNAYYEQILIIVAEYIEALYSKLGTFWHRKPSDVKLKKVLASLLDGQPAGRDDVEKALPKEDKNSLNQYALLQIKSHFTNNENKLGSVLTSHLESLWPGSCCIIYQKRLIVLINLTRFENSTNKLFSQELAYFLRESLLIAGMSRRFNSLFAVKAAYLQTEIALEMGAERHPMYWYFKFDDYAYWHLLYRGCGSFLPEQICHPALTVLNAYDKNNGTALSITLYTFIKSKYNSVAAAKELAVARSTFLKRMERIHSLTNLNLDTLEQRTYLALSFELYKEYG